MSTTSLPLFGPVCVLWEERHPGPWCLLHPARLEPSGSFFSLGGFFMCPAGHHPAEVAGGPLRSSELFLCAAASALAPALQGLAGLAPRLPVGALGPGTTLGSAWAAPPCPWPGAVDAVRRAGTGLPPGPCPLAIGHPGS